MTAIRKSLRCFAGGALLVMALLSGLTACSPSGGVEKDAAPAQPGPGKRLKVIATTSIVGDVVRQVAGDHIDLDVLLPLGADPHGFEPSPRDIAKIADADLVFANGAGLEEFLQPLIQNAGGEARLFEVSEGIELIAGPAGEEHQDEDEHMYDPHVWMDPNNVSAWTHNIEKALTENDPQNADSYSANAASYREQLQRLDTWVREQVALVPTGQRELVVDHLAYTYYAEQYGFQQAAAINSSFSTLAEPSAQELAQLEEIIQKLEVEAIFVGNSVNPALAERIAADTGTRLVQLYSGSLSEPGGGAETYLEYMQYNVAAIVKALIN